MRKKGLAQLNNNSEIREAYNMEAQIREQMSGPDLHVFTLEFLALKNGLVFSLFSGSNKNFEFSL